MLNPQRGDVKIMLAGQEYIMRPSFEAVASIEGRLDIGILGVANRYRDRTIGYRDAEAVISAGIAAVPQQKGPTNLKEAIRQEGLAVLLDPISTFVGYALTGGKEIDPESGEVQPTV